MKPNVLFILTDQLRKDCLGCYGNDKVKTPNIDELANRSVRFNRSYVANPICMPNRLSLFTGMYIRNHGLWTNGVMMYDKKRTLADELKSFGYQTASLGKIHFEPTYCEAEVGSMESRHMWKKVDGDIDWFGPYWGFDHVELTIDHTLPLAHYGEWFYKNGGTDEMLEKDKNEIRVIPAKLHDSTFVAERTIDYLKNKRDKKKPFFVVASFPDPHHPFDPPAEMVQDYTHDDAKEPIGSMEDLTTRPSHYMEHYRGGWHRKGKIVPERHPNGEDEKVERQRIINTYSMINLIDINVGKIMKTLEEENLHDNTIIVFTSDHGELLGDHGLWYKGPFYYEGLINVPLIIYNSNLKPCVLDDLISSVDIFPTVCDFLHMPVPEYVNGISHSESLLNESGPVRNKCIVEYRNGYKEKDVSSKAIVTKDLKYVHYQTGECELTDLKNDPLEKESQVNNPAYEVIVRRLREQLLTEVLATETYCPDQITFA